MLLIIPGTPEAPAGFSLARRSLEHDPAQGRADGWAVLAWDGEVQHGLAEG